MLFQASGFEAAREDTDSNSGRMQRGDRKHCKSHSARDWHHARYAVGIQQTVVTEGPSRATSENCWDWLAWSCWITCSRHSHESSEAYLLGPERMGKATFLVCEALAPAPQDPYRLHRAWMRPGPCWQAVSPLSGHPAWHVRKPDEQNNIDAEFLYKHTS